MITNILTDKDIWEVDQDITWLYKQNKSARLGLHIGHSVSVFALCENGNCDSVFIYTGVEIACINVSHFLWKGNLLDFQY
jgi:hypothetical protein